MSVKAFLCSLLLLLSQVISLPVSADWYQTQGSAPLSLGKEAARQQALEQALTEALLQAGASLTTVQSVTNGTLSEQQLDIAAQGELMDYVILNERRSQGRLWLTLRSDIWPNQKTSPQCTGSYHPGITLTRFGIQHPEQARFGQIFELGTAATTQLAQQLSPSVNLMTNIERQITTDSKLTRSLGLRQGADVLAKQQQSRLLLSGILTDISMEDGSWVSWRLGNIPRQFVLKITLEDSFTGERLLHKRYQVAAPWDYGKHDKVNVKEQGFWHSSYGQSAAQLLKQIARDVVNAQSCMKAIGHILQQSEEGVLMDLGRQAGIKPGDRFILVHRRQLQPGYYSETSSQAQFVVQQSHTDYSLLTPVDKRSQPVRVTPGDVLTALH